MDPNAVLKVMRDLVRAVQAEYGDGSRAADLAWQVRDLDEWLTSGGFLPDAWDAGSQTEHSCGPRG